MYATKKRYGALLIQLRQYGEHGGNNPEPEILSMATGEGFVECARRVNSFSEFC